MVVNNDIDNYYYLLTKVFRRTYCPTGGLTAEGSLGNSSPLLSLQHKGLLHLLLVKTVIVDQTFVIQNHLTVGALVSDGRIPAVILPLRVKTTDRMDHRCLLYTSLSADISQGGPFYISSVFLRTLQNNFRLILVFSESLIAEAAHLLPEK